MKASRERVKGQLTEFFNSRLEYMGNSRCLAGTMKLIKPFDDNLESSFYYIHNRIKVSFDGCCFVVSSRLAQYEVRTRDDAFKLNYILAEAKKAAISKSRCRLEQRHDGGIYLSCHMDERSISSKRRFQEFMERYLSDYSKRRLAVLDAIHGKSTTSSSRATAAPTKRHAVIVVSPAMNSERGRRRHQRQVQSRAA